MKRFMLKSKIHRAKVTMADINYEGSITIDASLMKMADILPYEQVDVYNITNGERFTTYAIPGEPDSGIVCLNGAAARKANIGDRIIIVTYCELSDTELKEHSPVIVVVDEDNKPYRIISAASSEYVQA